MALRTILVEDEPASLVRLRRLLEPHQADVLIVAEATTGSAAVETIGEFEPDLVFLDVSLPGFDGFEVLSALSAPPTVIFTTAHDEHAVRAFRANAADYLLKPIDPEQLATAVEKVAALKRQSPPQDWNDLLSALRANRDRGLKRIACRLGDSTIFVKVEEIQYFRADQGYTMVKCGSKELLIDTPLIELEGRLDPGDFVRIHRNTLVNMNHVNSLRRLLDGRMKIVLKDGNELASSRRYADNLRGFS
jgi:two-component system, LytTR family, response regulator